jgi:glycosyltransferase involved in cell wall biosynthesis
MATYNGERYVREQLDSILEQLGSDDEVVVVDDASSDGTVEVIEQLGDARVTVVRHAENRGYVSSFEEAIFRANGEYLFLSDQDDIWIPGRVDSMVKALGSARLVVGNPVHFGGEVTPFLRLRLRSSDSNHRVRNILGIIVGYRLHWGSAMAIRSDFKRLVLPFPAGTVESHDQWLALAANVAGDARYLDDDVVLHRLHSANVTPGGIRGIRAIVRARVQFLKELLIAIHRRRRLTVTGATPS